MNYVFLRTSSTFAALAAVLVAASANAEGVDAGTLIENTASASYTTGGDPVTVDSNTVTITVDELLNVVIENQDAGPVPIASGQAVLTYEITNTGNGPEAFNLTADPIVGGNDFNADVVGIAYDTNGDGVYEEGVDTLLPVGSPTPLVDADSTLTVFVIVEAPDAADGETAQVNLLAEAVTGTGTPGTVFTGQGENGGNAVVGNTNADADVNGTLIATLATLELLKSATIVDPFGGSEAVPGAIITFTITATTAGSGSLSDVVVSDAIPTGTAYVPDTLALDGSGLTDAADADAGQASASGIEVAIDTATASTNYEITFDVVID